MAQGEFGKRRFGLAVRGTQVALVSGMWNAQRRAELVVKILRGGITVEQAARHHDLEVAQIEDWRDRFCRGETAEHDPRRRPHGAPAMEEDSRFPALLQDVAELESVEWPTRPFGRRRRA